MGDARSYGGRNMRLETPSVRLKNITGYKLKKQGNGKGIPRIPLHWEYMQEEILSGRGSESELAYNTGEGGQSHCRRDLAVYILGFKKTPISSCCVVES